MSSDKVRIQLEPSSISVEVPRGALLSSILSEYGLEFPCGATAQCGGCRVRVIGGSLPVTESDLSVFSSAELADGWRLACQARADVPLVLECGQWQMEVLTDNTRLSGAGKSGLGIAVDVGTTTIAAQLIDLATGNVLAVQTDLNPQASFGADVMSRIQAALAGDDLTSIARRAIQKMIVKLAEGREQEITEVVLVGNTVMHHLFSGLDVEPLSRVPFESPYLGAQTFRPEHLGWPLSGECHIRFERCPGGFVGSDILAGVLAVGLHRSEHLAALVDLGTNGEIAIGNRNGIVCASTAAGPAFEAGSIKMGMRATMGAISRVSIERGEKCATIIGNVPPRGICGSGLVDAVAAGLECGEILASGRIANGTKLFPVEDPVVLLQSDIRELQLAKGAIASGFRLILRHLHLTAGDLRSIYLAGAFGNYIQIDSAIRIGLIEAPKPIIQAAGNTALRGAKMLLLADDSEFPKIDHISLAADPGFQEEYASCMRFPEVTSVA